MNPYRKLRRQIGTLLERSATATAVQLLRLLERRYPMPPATPVTPSGRVLFIGAHPDDESISCGATLARHAELGDKVTIVIVANGSGSRAAANTPQEAAARRAPELRAAVAHLNATELIALGQNDLALDKSAISAQLQHRVPAADLIYTHSPIDFHPDHLTIAAAVAPLLRPTQRVRLIECQCLLTPILVNRIHPADGTALAAKLAAIAAHASQANTVRTTDRQQRLIATAHRIGPIEQFWELEGTTFQRIMSQANWIDNKTTPFHSLRPRAFTDPLAILCGTRARLSLRRAAQIDTPKR